MPKIGFKPIWTEENTRRAKEFEASYTGKEPAVDIDEYKRWLHDLKE